LIKGKTTSERQWKLEKGGRCYYCTGHKKRETKGTLTDKFRNILIIKALNTPNPDISPLLHVFGIYIIKKQDTVFEVSKFSEDSALVTPLRIIDASGMEFDVTNQNGIFELYHIVKQCQFVLIFVSANTLQITKGMDCEISIKAVQDICSMKDIIENILGPRSVKVVITNLETTPSLHERAFRKEFAKDEGQISSADLCFVSNDNLESSLENIESLFVAMQSMVL